MQPMEPMKPLDFGTPWWPEHFGQPSSSGAQDGMRYAFFAQARRLVIERAGNMEVYDSGDHNIHAVAQRQSHDQSLSFRSQLGLVDTAELRRAS